MLNFNGENKLSILLKKIKKKYIPSMINFSLKISNFGNGNDISAVRRNIVDANKVQI